MQHKAFHCVKVDFHCRVIFTGGTPEHFTLVNEIEAMYERPRVNGRNVFSFQSLLSQFRGVAPDYNRYVYCLASSFLLLIQASLCQTRQTGRRGGEKSAKGKIERGRLSQTAAEIGPTKHKVLENLKKSWKYSWKVKNLRTSEEYDPCFIVVF